MPTRIAKRENLSEVLVHRRFLRICDSAFYVAFYWLNNRMAESLQNAMLGIGTQDLHGFLYLGISIGNIVLQYLLIVVIGNLERRRIGPSLHRKMAQAEGHGRLYFAGILALGGDLLLSLVIIPVFSLIALLRNTRHLARAFERIEKFGDDLIYNWSEPRTKPARYLLEFFLIDALLLSLNLRFFIDEITTKLDYSLVFLQSLFLAVSCFVPAVGAYYSIVKRWRRMRVMVPFLAAYGSSIVLLVVAGTRASPFLMFISGIPMFNNPSAIFAGTFSVATLLTGFMVWTTFSVGAREAYRTGDMQALRRNLSHQVASIMVTIIISVLPLMIVSYAITGEPPFPMLFVIILGYFVVSKVVYGPYSIRLEEADTEAVSKGRVWFLPNERLLYEVEEYPPRSIIYSIVGQKFSFLETYVLDRVKLRIQITNQRMLRIRDIANQLNGCRVLQEIRLADIENVHAERLLGIPTVLTVTINPGDRSITFYPLDPHTAAKHLLEVRDRFSCR
jgi:hypothetical protein